MSSFNYIMLFIFIALFLISPLTLIFHELGHAVPAILMTRKKVGIYIGSYGDPTKSLHFSFGLLEIWLKYNPFSWRKGLCIPSEKNTSLITQFIYTLTGPLASFLISVISIYLTYILALHGFPLFMLMIFFISSIFDLIVNLIPRENAIKLYNGEIIHNDGYQLKRILSFRKFIKEYEKGIYHYNQDEFELAAKSFFHIINRGFKDESVYRMAILSSIKDDRFNDAKELYDDFILHASLNSDDYANAGFCCSLMGQHDNALKFYNNSLELDPKNKIALNNKGFSFLETNFYEEAIVLFDKVIDLDKGFIHSYNNRGLAKIKLGMCQEGLDDLAYSFSLEENNPYYFRNLGIYHLDREEYPQALNYFTKAKELDKKTYFIEQLISQATK